VRCLLLLLLVACGSEDTRILRVDPEPAPMTSAPTTPAPTPAPMTEARRVQRAAAMRALQRPEPNPTAMVPDEVATAFVALQQIMLAAQTAGREAAERETEPCAAAHASITAAITAANTAADEHPLPGGRRPPAWVVAPRERYLTLCRALPQPAKRCARFDYRIHHNDECREVTAALSDAQREAMREMERPVAP